jgi:hypothetical protein
VALGKQVKPMIEPRDVERLGQLIASMGNCKLNPPALRDLDALRRIHEELSSPAEPVLMPVRGVDDVSAA